MRGSVTKKARIGRWIPVGDLEKAMASNFCDVFRHHGDADAFLFADSGVMRGHLRDYEMVASHRPMPAFPRKDIDARGYCLVKFTPNEKERARRWYGKKAT
jgi:hypothetical protein